MSGAGRPMVRRPPRDLTSPVGGLTFRRTGQRPGALPQPPPQPCTYLGRIRPRRIRRMPLSRSTSSHLRPSASPCRRAKREGDGHPPSLADLAYDS